MNRIILLISLVTLSALSGFAQNVPHLGCVYPAGGQQGTTFEVTICGRYLDATSAYVSGSGVTATIVQEQRPLTQAEQRQLRETLDMLQQKRKQGAPLTPEEKTIAEETREKLARFGRRPANPSLGEFVTVRVAVAPTATLGSREIRLLTRNGLSNPLVFTIGNLPEVTKEFWKNIQRTKRNMEPEIDPPPPIKDVVLPTTINGQLPPGGVDRYRFAAQKGQQLLAMVRARDLIPYISDAVPGWLEAVIKLSDANGREVAYSDDYRFHPDPVVFYHVPEDGNYTLEIKDSLYRGREDFVYRVTVGELPFVTSIFPLGGLVGSQCNLSVTGWNLSSNQIPLDLRYTVPGVHRLPENPGLNAIITAADSLPETFEQEPNDVIGNAQSVNLPVIVNGRIDRPGDMDVFSFSGNAGDHVVAEVLARRLESPVDSFLALTDSEGRQLAFNDDHDDPGSGLNTHHADSYLTFTLPTSERYFIHVGDTQHGGGSDYGYRLRVGPPHPDFALRVTPSGINVRNGGTTPVTVHALRKDGFTGPIRIYLKDTPSGFVLSGAEIPADKDQATITLKSPSYSGLFPFSAHMEGRATINNREVIHEAVPADDLMQAFAYRHLVPAQELKITVTGPPRRNPGRGGQKPQ